VRGVQRGVEWCLSAHAQVGGSGARCDSEWSSGMRQCGSHTGKWLGWWLIGRPTLGVKRGVRVLWVTGYGPKM
jgi:hypothetical protein